MNKVEKLREVIKDLKLKNEVLIQLELQRLSDKSNGMSTAERITELKAELESRRTSPAPGQPVCPWRSIIDRKEELELEVNRYKALYELHLSSSKNLDSEVKALKADRLELAELKAAEKKMMEKIARLENDCFCSNNSLELSRKLVTYLLQKLHDSRNMKKEDK